MKQLKLKLNSLLELQKEYIRLVEEESLDHSEYSEYYNELLGDLKKEIMLGHHIDSAKAVIQNPDFQKSMEPPNGTN